MLTMALADLASRSVAHTSKSITNLKSPVYAKLFFSSMQFIATSVVLHGGRRFSLQVTFLAILQITSFAMTLRRKNMVSHINAVCSYGFILLFGLVIFFYEV